MIDCRNMLLVANKVGKDVKIQNNTVLAFISFGFFRTKLYGRSVGIGYNSL